MADHFSELSESDFKYENKLGDRMLIKNNYWTQSSQNIVICQSLADQIFGFY